VPSASKADQTVPASHAPSVLSNLYGPSRVMDTFSATAAPRGDPRRPEPAAPLEVRAPVREHGDAETASMRAIGTARIRTEDMGWFDDATGRSIDLDHASGVARDRQTSTTSRHLLASARFANARRDGVTS
jgi:hypothetical protein